MRKFALLAVSLAVAAYVFSAVGCTSGGGETVLETDGRPILVEFLGPGCPACEAMRPVMEELEKEYGDRIDFRYYDTSRERDLVQEYGIEYIPTFLFVDSSGRVVNRLVGRTSAETMREELEKLLTR